MANAFSERGGARIDLFTATWPFATLSADGAAIKISCWIAGTFLFPKENVTALSNHHGVFSSGLRIEHTGLPHPSFIVFRSFNTERLLANLRVLGWTVCDHKQDVKP